MNQIQSVRFLYSGTPQVFTIPRGVCCVKIKAWGAGGGGRIGAGADEAEDWDGGVGGGGVGGTQTTGGAGGVNASGAGSNGQAGSSLQGGRGGASGGLLAGGGGGGGGGYFGGGGGAGQLNFVTQQDSAGGGGSSYVGGVTHGATLCTPQNTLPDADSALFLPPKTDDPEYVSGVGVGGSADPSGNGLVVIQYQTPSPRSQAVTDLMISVAMEQAALSSILYAEAQKLEKAKTLGLREDQMLQINHSITAMTNSVADLETILESKLSLFSCGGCQACGCLCTEEETL